MLYGWKEVWQKEIARICFAQDLSFVRFVCVEKMMAGSSGYRGTGNGGCESENIYMDGRERG